MTESAGEMLLPGKLVELENGDTICISPAQSLNFVPVIFREESTHHPARDAQFLHINKQVKQAPAKGIPAISVDTKKKELIGNYDNSDKHRVLPDSFHPT
jgi:hypothetical protein